VRKHDEEMDQFTIVADIPRVTALLERSDQGEPNKWNRIPLVETRP
jgi:hypothetical protein